MERKEPRSKPSYPKGLSLKDQTTQKYNLHLIIQQLKRKGGLEIKQLRCLINSAASILNVEPNLLKLESPMVIVGDIHGQFYDLLNIFERYRYPSQTCYLFLGDYVDRGKFCIEVVTLLLVLKVSYPKSIYLLRGNHQSRLMTSTYNFKTECQVKYNSEIYELFVTLFMYLPLCAIIDKKYFGVHGGISPNLQKINEIEKVDRFVELASTGLICDLLWSDPTDDNCETFKTNNLRSCSYFYSSKQSQKFLNQNALNLIIRGHQVQMKGYKYQYTDNSKPLTLTIFSAPKYCDTCYNKAAVAVFKKRTLTVDTFKQVQHPFVMNNYLNAFQVSFPLMAAKVTQVFSTLLTLKSVHQSLKKSTNAQESEIKSAIVEIKSIEDFLTNNATELEYLVKISTMVPTKLPSSSEMISEGLMRLLQLQCQQMNESLPLMFGPRQVQFVKIRASLAQEDDPEQQ